MKNATRGKTLLALLLAVAMTVSLAVMPVQAVKVDYTQPESELPSLAVGTAPTATEGATFTNTGDGQDWVSLTDARTFQVTIPLEGMTLQQAQDAVTAGTITWDLSRTEPYLNPEMYPGWYAGDALEDWETNNGQPLFTLDKVSAVETEGKVSLQAEISNVLYYSDGSVPHGSATYTMDYIGWYSLSAVNGEASLGSVAVKVYPYDTFQTMGEMYTTLDQIVSDAQGVEGISVAKYSMGKSEAGYDMPYLIIAKDGGVADKWLTLTKQAESDPASVLAKIASGELNDVQVPVMYSNVHSNEISAADSIFQFAKMLVNSQKDNGGKLSYTNLTGFTAAGETQLNAELDAKQVAIPDLVKDKATYLGFITGDNKVSGPVDMDQYYTSENVELTVGDLLDDVFFILVPEENVEGRAYMTRQSSGGFDLNRDNSFQTQNETQNIQKLIGTYNPVSLVELHGRVKSFQCEPCDPPHEPNFEYDLLAEHLMTGGEAFGIAAVANNDGYNSYVIPQRDYLSYTDDAKTQTEWLDPWDDMSTSYTPQYAMLHGTVAYTVECPAYNATVTSALAYGQLGQSVYIATNKLDYLKAQVTVFQRGVENQNSDSYDQVGQWFCDVYDTEGAEADIFRPEYDGAGQNGNFYPECYIIPTDSVNQSNLQDAYEMAEYLTRNDVTVNVATASFTYDGVTYPAGTLVVSMYQAKRSVANGVLYNGTVITGWPVLYSEGITSFNKTRGFDMATCAEPAAYQTIIAACGTALNYDSCKTWLAANAKSAFTGVTGYQVILSNASEDSTAAVNALLQSGKTVGMITEGDYAGSFICAYGDWQTVADQYVITGTGLSSNYPAAKIITKAPTLYINGLPSDDDSGYVHHTAVSNSYEYNYDRQSMDLLNFKTTADPAEADIIIGASGLDDGAVTAIESGTPYIGYGDSALGSVTDSYDWRGNAIEGKLFSSDALVMTYAGGASMDALAYVTYPTTTLVNASYVAEGDDILYGYGANYFSKIPDSAQILVQLDGSKKPLEGFLCATGDHDQDFLNNSVQGISYTGNDRNGKAVNVVLFANTLTNKVHQRDEFNYISNFAFSNLLGDAYTAASAPSDGGSTSGGSTSGGSSTAPIVNPSTGGSTGTTTEPTDSAKLAGDTFTDVSASDWYADSVGQVLKQGLMNGTTATTFGPSGMLNRGMLVTILYRVAGSPAVTGSSGFADVPDGFWCADAVVWGVSKGIIQGYDATTFGPADPVTREQTATFLYRYAKQNGADVSTTATLSSFSDAASVSSYATEAMTWAVGCDIVQGTTDGKLNPTATATRAQTAVMVLRAQSHLQAD